MTIFRVNPDRDLATIVNFDRNLYSKYHFRGPKDSLSSISMTYYKTFHFWPMIWADNYTDVIENPNDIPANYPLLIRRRDRIADDDRYLCDVLFDSWKDYPSAREARIAKIRLRMQAKVQAAAQAGEPAWAQWTPPWAQWDSEPAWARWNNGR